MSESPFRSFLKDVFDRATHPFVSSYVLAWLVCNRYVAAIVLFGDSKGKVDALNGAFQGQSWYQLVLFPFLWALFWTLGMPHVNLWIAKWREKPIADADEHKARTHSGAELARQTARKALEIAAIEAGRVAAEHVRDEALTKAQKAEAERDKALEVAVTERKNAEAAQAEAESVQADRTHAIEGVNAVARILEAIDGGGPAATKDDVQAALANLKKLRRGR